MKRLKIYTASKLSRAPMWRDLSRQWQEVDFVSRWPFRHVDQIPDDAPYARVFWRQNLEDIVESDVVLVYADGPEHLRGALVEAGMGIAFGKDVIVIGDHNDYGTWRYSALVHNVDSFDEARTLLKTMAL